MQVVTGLKVNFSKSRIYGIGVDQDEVGRVAKSINCTHGKLPFLFLGIPVGMNMSDRDNWSIVVDNFNNRLSTWKTRLLSSGGRLTLAKAVLGSLPLYYFSLFKALVKVIKCIESLRRRFFCFFKDDEKKINWV